MADDLKKYSKSELLQILNEKCSEALQSFPPPHTFEFRTHVRDGEENVGLKIGYTVTKRTRKVKEEVWVEEYNIFDIEENLSIPQVHRRAQTGNAGPLMGYDPIYQSPYGAKAKTDFDCWALYNGLYYTIEDDTPVNRAVWNAKSIKGNGAFGKLNDSGFIGPYTNSVRALFRFVLVHCDLATHYEEFKDVNEKTQGLKSLFKVLNDIGSRTPSEEQQDPDDDNETLFLNSDGNKRPYEGDDENLARKA